MRRIRDERNFLADFYARGDVFPNLLARSTYLSKFSRDDEAWTDTIVRVVDGNCDLANVELSERKALFDTLWNMHALPPGRGLWTGGVPNMPSAARYNCVKGTTRFWADGALRTLAEMAGAEVAVICKDGQSRIAQVRSFGVQTLRKYSFGPQHRSQFRMEFSATENHRWFTDNRGEVTDLQVGDTVLVSPATDINRFSEAYQEGYVHGLVYGDGCAVKGRPKNYQIRLCGKKARFLADIQKSAAYRGHSFPPSYKGDPHVRLHTGKSLDGVPMEEETFDYQAGFLDGWLATDGFLTNNDRRISLEVSDAEGLAWVQERAPLLGYVITGRHTNSVTKTNYGERTQPSVRITLSKEPVKYVLLSISEETETEEVFCVVEPETKSFTLEGGMITGNCWGTTLRSVDDWAWTVEMLMCGGGVGISLSRYLELPVVQTNAAAELYVRVAEGHPDTSEVFGASSNAPPGVNAPWRPGSVHTFAGYRRYEVPDTRQGWAEALRQTLIAAFRGESLEVDVSQIRPRGASIRTFGGTACGPGPLVELLASAWRIVRARAGEKLTDVDCLDVTTFIGKCVKAGNVRRSALIVLGDPNSRGFRDAKKNIQPHLYNRYSSNNSIVFTSEEQLRGFDYMSLAQDNLFFGEPGIINMPLIWKTDPGATCINPCAEIPLHDHEACNLAEFFPARARDEFQLFSNTIPLLSRYALRQRLEPLEDAESEAVRVKNMRVGVGLGGICDFDWTPKLLQDMRGTVQETLRQYAHELGLNTPIATTTVKPSGTVSLLCGSSPGVHAPYANFYIRRTRLAEHEPMAKALLSAGVPFEHAHDDSRALLFTFPSRHSATTTVQNETTRDQLQRQLDVQTHWADNAVSATVTFEGAVHRPDGSLDEGPTQDNLRNLAALMKEYIPQVKSTSFLARSHGYAQPPYEPISEERYHELVKGINMSHPLTKGGDMEVDECSNGACPIR